MRKSVINFFASLLLILVSLGASAQPENNKEDASLLMDSIVSNLSDFVTARNFDLNNCENAIKTQRALVLGASLLSGLMFPETMKHLEQGGN